MFGIGLTELLLVCAVVGLVAALAMIAVMLRRR